MSPPSGLSQTGQTAGDVDLMGRDLDQFVTTPDAFGMCWRPSVNKTVGPLSALFEIRTQNLNCKL